MGVGASSKDPGKKEKAGVAEESNGQNRWEADLGGVGGRLQAAKEPELRIVSGHKGCLWLLSENFYC